MKNGHDKNIFLTWEEDGICFTNTYSAAALPAVFKQFKELFERGCKVTIETR